MTDGSKIQLPTSWDELKSSLSKIKESAAAIWESETLFSTNNWLQNVIPNGHASLAELLSQYPGVANYLSPEVRPEGPTARSPPWFVRFFGLTFQIEGLVGDSPFSEVHEVLKSGRGIERVRVSIPTGYSRKYAYPIGNRWADEAERLVHGIVGPNRAGEAAPHAPPDKPQKLRASIVEDIQKIVNLCVPISSEGWAAWSLSHGCPVDYLKVQYPFLNVVDLVSFGLSTRNGYGGFSTGSSWLDAYRRLVMLVVFSEIGEFATRRSEYALDVALEQLGVPNPPRLSATMYDRWRGAISGGGVPEESQEIVRRVCRQPDNIELTNNLGKLAEFLGSDISPQEVVNRIAPFLFLGALKLSVFGPASNASVQGWDDLCDSLPPETH